MPGAIWSWLRSAGGRSVFRPFHFAVQFGGAGVDPRAPWQGGHDVFARAVHLTCFKLFKCTIARYGRSHGLRYIKRAKL
jgi:hypothetical protein